MRKTRFTHLDVIEKLQVCTLWLCVLRMECDFKGVVAPDVNENGKNSPQTKSMI